MKNFDEYEECIRQLLADVGGRRYDGAMIEAGLLKALGRYDRYFPRRVEICATVSIVMRTDVFISWLPAYDQVIYGVRLRDAGPYDDKFREQRQAWGTWIRFPRGKRWPRIKEGEKMWLEVSERNGVRDVDGCRETTIPDGYMMMLCAGAAGECMLLRASAVTEVFGKRPEDGQQLRAEGKRLIDEYESEMGRRSVMLGGDAFASSGFEV